MRRRSEERDKVRMKLVTEEEEREDEKRKERGGFFTEDADDVRSADI